VAMETWGGRKEKEGTFKKTLIKEVQGDRKEMEGAFKRILAKEV